MKMRISVRSPLNRWVAIIISSEQPVGQPDAGKREREAADEGRPHVEKRAPVVAIDQKRLVFGYYGVYKSDDRGETLVNVTPLKLEKPVNIFKRSYEYELQHFFNSIRTGTDVISDGNEALSVMKITDSIYKSAASGKEIIFK